MSTLGTYRLIDAIENGSYTYSSLNTALATARTRSEFLGALNDRAMLSRMCASKNCVDTIFGTAGTGAAEADFLNADPTLLCAVVPNSRLVLDKVFNTGNTTEQLARRLFTVDGMVNALYSNVFAAPYMGRLINSSIYYRPRLSALTLEVVSPILSMTEITHTGSFIAITSTAVLIRRKGFDVFVRITGIPSTFVPTDVEYSSIDSKVVVVGSAGPSTIYVSSDGGETWTAGTNFSSGFKKVIRLPSLWAACGTNPGLATSPDGVTWTSRIGAGSSFNDIASDGTSYVVVGDSSIIYYSSGAGTTWTNSGAPASTNLIAVTAGPTGTFIAVGAANVNKNTIKSTNSGVTWGASTAILTTTTNLNSITYSPDGYYIVGSSTSAASCAAYSTDGTTWTGIGYSSATTASVSMQDGSSKTVLIMPAATFGVAVIRKVGDLTATLFPTLDETGSIIDTSSTSKGFVFPSGYFINSNTAGFITNAKAK